MCPVRNGYRNFAVAVYCPVGNVLQMGDLNWLENNFDLIQKHIEVDKVYLETCRAETWADRESMLTVKDFFASRGVKTSGGITTALTQDREFQSFCYTDPEQREEIRKIVAFTAELFDEIILDDFYFTNCKCELCIKAKGDKSWTDFRLEQMRQVSREIIEEAKGINPNVTIIVKYPNWYDHFHFTGYDLEAEPRLFDMIYTGTETRDPVHTHQHLQQYQSYAIMRYLENVRPGKNGGGWVDPGTRQYLDRYAEQIALTLFAKSKELTLFCFTRLVDAVKQDDGSPKPLSVIAPVAGGTLERVDSFLGKLGEPYGLASYNPCHSAGEAFLHSYIGMLGIPIEMTPEFPAESNTILLTESAKVDAQIVEKIKAQLLAGKTVVITSGLLIALQGEGIEDIVELEYTGKRALVNQFSQFADVYRSDTDILIPQIRYATNDSWELITCLKHADGHPLLLRVYYGGGVLYILTIPDTFSDLYHLPRETLTQIKQFLMQDFPVQVESTSQVSLFTYDNDTFIVHSFLPHRATCSVVVKRPAELRDLMSDEEVGGYERGGETVFEVSVEPHSYRVFKFGDVPSTL